jgi:uncharacterized protein (DUF433 family)
MTIEMINLYMTVENVIDETGDIPSLRDRRINMLDIMTAIRSGNAEENFEYWNLGEEEIEAIKEYYVNNKKELEDILDERTPKR